MAGKPALDNEAIYRDRSFLGHPKGLLTICLRYLCNSFSYYGCTAILIYYLYKEAPVGLGFAEKEAAQLLSLYFALVVICGVVGSYMADRVFGPRRALRLMNMINPFAYIILAIPGSGVIGYAAAMGLLLCTSMVAGQSLNNLTSKLYVKGDERRDNAFAYIYIIANIGAAIPAVTGAISLHFGYHAAFALCAVASIVGSTIYLTTERRVFGTIAEEPADPFPEAKKKQAVFILIGAVVAIAALLAFLFVNKIITISQFANTVSSVGVVLPAIYLIYVITSPKTKPEEKRRVLFIIPIFVAYCFTNLVSYQGSTVLSIYAERSVDMNFFGVEISPASFITLQSIFSILLGSAISGLWAKLGKKQPSTPGKMGIGTLCYGISILIMVLPFQIYGPGEKASPLWLVAFYAIYTIGEAICWAAGTSAATIVAPAAFATQMLTIWSMGQSTGASLSALAANFYKEGSESMYFLVIGVAVVSAAVIILVLQKPLAHGMGIDKKD